MSDEPQGDGWRQASDGHPGPPDQPARAVTPNDGGAVRAVNRFGEEHPIWAAAGAAAVMLAVRLLFAVVEDRGVLDTAWLVVSSAAIYLLGFSIVAVGATRMRAHRHREQVRHE